MSFLGRAILLMGVFALFSCAHLGDKSHGPSYGARLESYPYPFPVKMFKLKSQNQSLEMAYMHIEGEAGKPTVLLLHGKNFSGSYWETTAKLLASEGYSVLIPDQIGFGKSSKPEYYQYSFPQLVNNTLKLTESLQIEKFIVVGHSMGGMLATRMGLLHPEKTQKLVLVNPIGLEDYLDYVEYKEPQFFYKNIELPKTPAKVKAYQKKNYYDGKWKEAYDPWVKMHAGWIHGPDWKRIAWNNALTYDLVFSEPIFNELEELEVPTRLIIGTRDRTGPGRGWKKDGVDRKLGQYQDLGKEAAGLIPDSKLYELEGLGHMPHIEDFERFKNVFLKSLSAKE